MTYEVKSLIDQGDLPNNNSTQHRAASAIGGGGDLGGVARGSGVEWRRPRAIWMGAGVGEEKGNEEGNSARRQHKAHRCWRRLQEDSMTTTGLLGKRQRQLVVFIWEMDLGLAAVLEGGSSGYDGVSRQDSAGA
uniref:Uncharacterized protein n=1 Tax=Oryza punctata TaxID=4537 RepID=A0A0E0M5V1_ORYPU